MLINHIIRVDRRILLIFYLFIVLFGHFQIRKYDFRGRNGSARVLCDGDSCRADVSSHTMTLKDVLQNHTKFIYRFFVLIIKYMLVYDIYCF